MSTHIHPIVSVETDDQGWRTGAYTTTATTTGGKRAADRELVDGIGVQQGVRQVPYSITMPLVILSGYPCSGKTAFAELLASTIRASSPPDCKVVIINEESLHMGKQEYYSGNKYHLNGILIVMCEIICELHNQMLLEKSFSDRI